ncbi:Disease resistance protein [Melia azedarach]|uniref:Disease resistance protein n=1 Tax=Melia azedarach TaxID=155640 RepID=A0ACC1XDW2_MELAZ|nr:Disease resistance protein [Melia azedarach]
MSIIGEAVLTVTMEMLFKKLASEVLPLFGRQEKIRGDLEDWQKKLRKIKAVLDDAEDKQMRDEKVKDWLGDLKNLAYDVEDVLDEFATEALRRNSEEEKKAIVELLLKDDLSPDHGGLSVIPITGMGGLGKTTLAQLVYNDKTVDSHFDLKVWACVSEDFDATRITKSILKSIGVQTTADDNLNLLQGKLKNELSRKKFLLILDDMWNENYGDWTILKLPFADGAPGSKIIVTTRSQTVALKMGTIPAYPLRELSNDDALLVFTQHSLGTRDFGQHQYLREIGAEIVKRCHGLPLAARALGGLLRGKYNISDWEKVLKNKIWDLTEEGNDIMRALKVSYYYLPAHLKRCFAYSSLFPKDYEFNEQEIVLLWMAEGLLPLDVNGKRMEESGNDYFKELQSRSFFQQSNMNTSRLTGLQTLCYFVVGKNNGSRLTELKYLKNLSGKLKISSLENVKDVGDAEEAELHGKGKLNELCLEWANSNDNSRDLENETSVLYMLRPHGNLKELTVKGYGGSNFPIWLGDSMFSNLILLKFENCGMCTSLPMVGQLPSLKHLFIIGITRLKSLAIHLERLKISLCPNLVSFPGGGLPRTKLTYLYLCNCEKLKALPNKLRNVTSLQQLAISNCPSIEYFPEDGFPTDLCSLEIDYLNMYKPLFESGLYSFSSVTQLSLSGEGSDVVSFPLEDTAMALPVSLTKLSVDNFPDLERLSSTIGNLTSLEILRLSDCPKLKYFPEKGLPHSLLNLQITGCPLIEERCKKNKGQYWNLIADIPYVGL